MAMSKNAQRGPHHFFAQLVVVLDDLTGSVILAKKGRHTKKNVATNHCCTAK